MHFRMIPNTDLLISELTFGNFIYGSFMWGKTPKDEPEGIRLQNLAWNLGVNFFDTADAYDNGRAERMLAQTIKYAGAADRDKLVISTKFGYDFYTDPGTPAVPGAPPSHRERKQDFSPAFLNKALEESLRRLGVDHIDLWQAHNLKLPHMTDELVTALEKIKASGKIRHWGIALGPAIGWREEGVIALEQWPACVTVQTVFNMLEQHPGRELCEIAVTPTQSHGAGILARVPHSSGILQDLYDPNEKFTDHRKFRDRNWLTYGLKKVEFFRAIQAQHNCTLGQLAIKWLLSWPACVSVQPNITSEKELREFAAACDGQTLAPAEMLEIQNLVESDFGLGADAHACDLKSSVAAEGHTSSHYQAGQPTPTISELEAHQR